MTNTNTGNKLLVIDDEITDSQKENTIYQIGVPEELALFATCYDEAVEILVNEDNIGICFTDLRLPKNHHPAKANYKKKNEQKQEQEEWWGEKLIPKITDLNSGADIIVYSAYATASHLQRIREQYESLITAFLPKPSGLDKYKEYYDRAIKKRSSLKPASPDYPVYNDFNQKDNESILKVITQEIKGLLKENAENMVKTGKDLREARVLLKRNYLFEQWLETEFGISGASASRKINAARRLEPFRPEEYNRFSVTALYELTFPTVPDEALARIIQSPEFDNRGLTVKQAKQIKDLFNNPNNQRKIELAVEDRLLDPTSGKLLLFDNNQTNKALDSSSPLIDNNQTNKSPDSSSPKPEIVQVIPLQRIWHLGAREQHKVVAADPNSPIFLRELPSSISLCLCFPPNKNWQFELKNTFTTNVFHTQLVDFDNLLILEIVEKFIEGSTDGYDAVVVCYIPDPKILSIIHKMGCRAFVADPDYDKCLNLITSTTKLL